MPENISLFQILITTFGCVSSGALSLLLFGFKDRFFHGKRHQIKREKLSGLIELSKKVISTGLITREDRLHLENELRALYSIHFCCKCIIVGMYNQNFHHNLKCIQKSGIMIEYDEYNHKIKPKGELTDEKARRKSGLYGWISAIIYFSIPLIIIFSLVLKAMHPNLLLNSSEWVGFYLALSLTIASILAIFLSMHLEYKRISHLCSLKEKIILKTDHLNE